MLSRLLHWAGAACCLAFTALLLNRAYQVSGVWLALVALGLNLAGVYGARNVLARLTRGASGRAAMRNSGASLANQQPQQPSVGGNSTDTAIEALVFGLGMGFGLSAVVCALYFVIVYDL